MKNERILKLADEAIKHLEHLHWLLLDISRQCEESIEKSMPQEIKQAA